MNTMDAFKQFVRKQPILIEKVKENALTWQQAYEIYDLYGENHPVWDDYLKVKEQVNATNEESAAKSVDWMNIIKQVDIDKISNSIDSVQRILSLLSDFKSPSGDGIDKVKKVFKRFDD